MPWFKLWPVLILLSGCTVVTAPIKVATSAVKITAKTVDTAATVTTTTVKIAGTAVEAGAAVAKTEARKTDIAIDAAHIGLAVARKASEETEQTEETDTAP